MKYDKEEKGILDAYEAGEMKFSKPSKKEKVFKKKRWKWGFLIKRLFPVSSIDILRAI